MVKASCVVLLRALHLGKVREASLADHWPSCFSECQLPWYHSNSLLQSSDLPDFASVRLQHHRRLQFHRNGLRRDGFTSTLGPGGMCCYGRTDDFGLGSCRLVLSESLLSWLQTEQERCEQIICAWTLPAGE